MTVPRLVCFDLGGVLVRTCQTWAQGCAAAGIEVRDLDQSGDPLAVVGVYHELQIGRIDARDMAEHLSGRTERVYSVEEVMAVHAAWLQGEYAGVAAIVDRLHELAIMTAALSNTDGVHWSQMVPGYPTVAGLRHKIASHELGLRKPDPAIYRALEEQSGCSGEEILFFDDLPENIDGAAKLGWRAVRVDPASEPADIISRALADHGVDVGVLPRS